MVISGNNELPYYGPEHLILVRPSKTSIELSYDIDGDVREDIREVRLYKNHRVSKPCIVLWDHDKDGEITPDESYVFEKGCREAEGWFKKKGI